MTDLLNDILNIIRVDFFISYGLYSLAYIILIIVTLNNENIKKIDRYCNSFISFAGISYLLIYISAYILFFVEADTETKNTFLERLSGRHWFAYCLQPLLWFVPTQLLRIKQLNRLLLIRLAFAFILMISFEQYVIIMTSVERDYIPWSWTYQKTRIEFPIMEIVPAICFKITYFVLLSFLYHWIKLKIKKLALLISPSFK
jgi:hypothetical protein